MNEEAFLPWYTRRPKLLYANAAARRLIQLQPETYPELSGVFDRPVHFEGLWRALPLHSLVVGK